ncbi:nuclear pore complex protein Nup54-like [Ylistrum balloti]|uniref:nuclear pore complex protein Nup54-like n=1 Tax=Ylistrum balloti TaxID=509963 RepID=UPI002905CF6A|nr:nuclear pore complex protein Nup54-like [Ylistrum balloti]
MAFPLNTGGFGTVNTATPSFGTTATAPTFGFGTATTTAGAQTLGFGTATSNSAAPSFGGFGTTTTAAPTFGGTTAPTFGFGGTATTSAAPTFGFGGGLGTTTSATPSFTGFGTTTTSAGGLTLGGSTGFGTGTATGFGTGTGTAGFGGFGGTSSFGGGTSGFSLGGTGTTGTGLLGGGTTGTGLFGVNQQQQQQQQQQQNLQSLENLSTAITTPQLYGDERDAIIAKWNQLQAYWGTGKGYFSQNGCVTFTPENPYCKFKAIGYSCLPKSRNEDGLVAITIKKKESEVSAGQQLIVDSLFKMLGSKPQYSVCVEGIRPLPDDKTELVIYILERPDRGPARRITALDTANFLKQNNILPQLQSQIMAEDVRPKTGFTKEQHKQYLDNTPSGIHPLIWQQAKLDNPDPETLIPVPMVRFKELSHRMKHQEQQTKLHHQRMDMIATDLTQLQQKQVSMLAKLDEYKRKHLELGHRLLQVVVKQEIFRKMGYAIQAEEEQLRVQLEKSQAELNHPTQFKGRLNELMSQIRMQNHLAATRTDVSYQIDPALQDEIKQLLKQQQEGLRHLIQIIKEDGQDLQLIEQNLETPSRR